MADVAKNSSATLSPTLTESGSLSRPRPFSLFHGILDSWELSEGRIRLTATNVLNTWQEHSLSRHSSSCRWRAFKGPECQYVGSAVHCDRSYTRCVELGNQANFGGFRFLPDIVDKEVWWGKDRDV